MHLNALQRRHATTGSPRLHLAMTAGVSIQREDALGACNRVSRRNARWPGSLNFVPCHTAFAVGRALRPLLETALKAGASLDIREQRRVDRSAVDLRVVLPGPHDLRPRVTSAHSSFGGRRNGLPLTLLMCRVRD